MQHEREYDKRTATPDVRTLDDMCRDAARMDRQQQDLTKPPNVVPEPYDPFVDMLRRAGDFAVKMSRAVTGHPRRKPLPPDTFKI